jgi:hypothetical protein
LSKCFKAHLHACVKSLGNEIWRHNIQHNSTHNNGLIGDTKHTSIDCRCAECHDTECHYAECHDTKCHYAECRDNLNVKLSVFMLNVTMLSVFFLNVIMLSVFMLNGIMLSVFF